jgi:hypothetical protein
MATMTEQMRNLAAEIASGHEQRRAWLNAMRDDVDAMHHEWRGQRRDRRAWVGALRKEVGALRKEIASDHREAHQAWLGIPGASSRRAGTTGGGRARPSVRPTSKAGRRH